MDPRQPFNTFLPGKKIQIVLVTIIILVAGYFFVPRIINYFRNAPDPGPAQKNLNLLIPKGDPTTRDSDGDGIADWREIAVGLDPYKKETIKGIPDAQAFETFKENIGLEAFREAETNVTDTDKISLTLSNEITRTIQTGSADSNSIVTVTTNEVLNYIDSQKKQFIQFSAVDLNIVETTLETNQVYKKNMEFILRDDTVTKNLASNVKAYLEGGGSEMIIRSNLASIEKTITALKSTPVPSAASNSHLAIVNEMQGVYQTIRLIDSANSDETQRLGISALLQDYAMLLSTNIGKLSIYFSIALAPSGYIN